MKGGRRAVLRKGMGYAAGLAAGAAAWQVTGAHSASYVFVPLTIAAPQGYRGPRRAR